MTKPLQKVEKFAKLKLYGQSANMTPLPLIGAAMSFLDVREKTGLNYSGFLFEFKDNYGSMLYIESDLERMGEELFQRISADQNYLGTVKAIYNDQQQGLVKLREDLRQLDLSQLSVQELLPLCGRAIEAMQAAVGVGHVIEAFGLKADVVFKDHLKKYIQNQKELNQAFAVLSTPESESFLKKAGEALRAIKESNYSDKLIARYIRDYGWSKNTYASRVVMTKTDVVADVKLHTLTEDSGQQLIAQKKQIIERYALPGEVTAWFRHLAYVSLWQDERKAWTLIAIDCLFQVLEALSPRVGVELALLRYAMPEEILGGKVASLREELAERMRGSFYAVDASGWEVATGKDYERIKKELTKEATVETKQINGLVASTGKVIGPVKICIGVEMLDKVKPGDILVASMTRPEYLPAMRQAAAFVTDEGGITCHAAIVAREMKKPCIIGTKNATKILKDGDLVQVDAVHGAVRIL